ncbi:MAG: multicopper oxidase family protein [Blastocatellia bacterium]
MIRTTLRAAMFWLVVCGLAATAAAQSSNPVGKDNPCAYKDIDPKLYGMQPFQNPPEIVSSKGSLNTTMVVQYTENTKLGGCPVTLRTYNGKLVGPTLRVKPGDVMNILLDNQLPKETPNEVQKQYEQENQNAVLSMTPFSFNTTNLHYHGLHVSPTGNSDNVLLAIPPRNKFQYEVKLPANHPSGAYWYHAHTHGSTSIQVGSGMAGALIIEDDPAKIPQSLREANQHEKVLVFQTILYNTEGRLDNITTLFPGPGDPTPQNCAQPGNAGTWPCAKRRVTINGQIVPIISMRPGEVQRWRMIDTSFRESIMVRLEGHALHEIALDGIYLGRIDTWYPDQPIDLEAGYRSDVLVQAGKPGRYNLIDAGTPPTRSLRAVTERENLLAIVEVCDPAKDSACVAMDMKLPTSAEMAPLAPFPGVDLSKTAVGVQQATFKLGTDMGSVPGVCQQNPNAKDCKQRNYFQINFQAFNESHVRQLRLGETEQWTLTTVGDPSNVPNAIPPLPHVFHIHVNPFQFSRTGPDGNPEMVWKDTLLIPGGATLNIFTRYLDYIGKFVMHCHILDHEDLGMMEVDEVVDEASGVKTHHH